jgi:hypothetical protein
MAKKDDSSQKKGRNTIKDTLDTFRTLNKMTTAGLYGTDEKFHDENDRDLSDIRQTINSVTKQFKQNTGGDIIEFFNSVNASSQGGTRSRSKEAAQKQLMDISKVIEHPEMFNIQEIFSQEMNRVQLYNSYRMIYENIPQMNQALNTYVDNIMSPDDFTKTSFNIIYKDTNITSSDLGIDSREIVDNCKKLIDTYKLETITQKILEESLKIGDCFVAVLNTAEEIEKNITLSEDGLMTTTEEVKRLTADDIVLSEDEIVQLNNILTETTIKKPVRPDKEKFFKDKKQTKALTEDFNAMVDVYNEETKVLNEASERIKKDLAQLLNNVEVSNDYRVLFEDNIKASQEFDDERKKSKKKALFNNFEDKNGENPAQKFDNRKTKKNNKGSIKVTGSIVKMLKPERIVKLSLDDIEYGYYYIENLENSPDYLTTGSYSLTSNIFSNFKTEQTDKPDMMNAKYRLITDVFVRNLAKKIDKQFVNSHSEFKDIIYSLLRQNNILNKQVRITYLKPSEVIHFGLGNDEYHDSIFQPVHFTAKLYLAVLSSQVMMRLVRSPEKRAFYLEVDLDADTESVVQSFIRDTKTKDIKMSDFGGDINTIMNSVGTFQDYFIPVVDGQKPVEIDTLSGLNVEITNDFIEYLLKAMISGMGIPPEFLSYAEQTEFARSLGMMNGKFVRSIIMYQKVFGEQFTKLFRILYTNEYLGKHVLSSKKRKIKKKTINQGEIGTIDTKEEKEQNDENNLNLDISFDVTDLEIKFPSPQSLNMTTLSEQISNSQSVIEFLTTTMVGEDQQELSNELKKEITKDILSTFDWEKYEGLLDKAKLSVQEGKIKKASIGSEDGGEDY